MRYRGWYSNAARGRRRRLQGESGATPRRHSESGDEARSRRLSWSQLIRKVYEIDPLLCTFCGAAMRIVAFIVDRSSVRRLLQHLDVECQQPEPLARSRQTHTAEKIKRRLCALLASRESDWWWGLACFRFSSCGC